METEKGRQIKTCCGPIGPTDRRRLYWINEADSR